LTTRQWKNRSGACDWLPTRFRFVPTSGAHLHIAGTADRDGMTVIVIRSHRGHDDAAGAKERVQTARRGHHAIVHLLNLEPTAT